VVTSAADVAAGSTGNRIESLLSARLFVEPQLADGTLTTLGTDHCAWTKVEKEGPEAVTALEQERVDLVARIGENIEVVGASRFDAEDDEVLASYVHPPAQKIGVLVRAHGSPDLARLVAMHIAFANPRFVTREEVPADEIDAEREILEKLPDLEGKPDDVKSKMIEGRLAKGFFADSVLTDQPWIHNPDQTVGQALAEHGAEVRDFVRYALAG